MAKIRKITFIILAFLVCITGAALFLLSKYTITLKEKADTVQSSTPIPIKKQIIPLFEKKVALPLYHISFNVPANLRIQSTPTGNPYVSNLEEIKAATPNAIDSGSDYQKKGVHVIYSILQPWTPNIYNIPFGNAFNGAGHTTQVDSTALLKEGSILAPNQVTIYTYLLGDDDGHNRGKYGMAYQGDVRLDMQTSDNVVTNEAIYFKCTDDKAKNISETCETTLKTFLSTLRVEEAKLIDSPPSFSSKDYFSNLTFKKRQFDPKERILQNNIFTKQNSSFAYFSAEKDIELTNLSDSQLQVMRCMPQQLYLTQNGYPYYSETGESNIYTIRTTDGNNLFHEVQVTDSNLLNIINKLQANNPGIQVTHFFACQTDDGRYIIKFSVPPTASQKIVTNIAVMNKQGDIQDIAAILLPGQNIYCEQPLALTTDNIFYFGCNAMESNMATFTNLRYIYKVDLNAKTEELISQCESTSSESNPTPINNCQ